MLAGIRHKFYRDNVTVGNKHAFDLDQVTSDNEPILFKTAVTLPFLCAEGFLWLLAVSLGVCLFSFLGCWFMSQKLFQKGFVPLNIAVLTVSDTRTEEDDGSGRLLVERVQQAGHKLAEKKISKDDIYRIRAIVSNWIAEPDIHAILITGGTGFTLRDSTPEAVKPLLDKEIEGFGELFRQISVRDIGTSTIQSRALGGFANHTVLFCMPGSTNACATAWDELIRLQLDSETSPCNFVGVLINR